MFLIGTHIKSQRGQLLNFIQDCETGQLAQDLTTRRLLVLTKDAKKSLNRKTNTDLPRAR